MSNAFTIYTYDHKCTKVHIPDEIVDNCYLILYFEMSGDQVYIFIDDMGQCYTVDASKVVPDATPRVINYGPENLRAIFPEDMIWEETYAA